MSRALIFASALLAATAARAQTCSPEDLQYTFLLDASTAVGSTGWSQEVNFVSDMILNDLTPGSRVAAGIFSTGYASVLNFDSDQTRSSLSNVIKAEKYVAGKDGHTLTALNSALAQIDAHGKGLRNVIVLLSTGVPAGGENPCSAANAPLSTTSLRAHHAEVLLVTVGSPVSTSTLACLWNAAPADTCTFSAARVNGATLAPELTSCLSCQPAHSGCLSSSECAGTTPICNPATAVCGACTSNAQCPSAAPMCLSTGACGSCTAGVQCSGATPVCQSSGVCAACTTPPVITVPADLTVTTNGTCQKAVTWAASAVDCAGQSVSLSCSKASGSSFAAGTTTVTCTAGASSASFHVTVQPAGVCTIGGACVAAGTANPANQCQDCEPSLSASSYTNKAATASCSDGDSCTSGDHCDGNGACAPGAQACGGNCSAHTTSASCGAVTNCSWSSSAGCYCSAIQPLQVMFVMDSSGSVTSAGWTQEKSFVTGMINTGLAQSTPVGVVEFSTSVTAPLNFDSDQTRSSLTGVVNGLSYLNQNTYTLDAMNKAVSSIETHDKGGQSMILLITDGDPNPVATQNPCSTTLAAAATLRAKLAADNITVVLITVGPDVNAGTLGCLYGYDSSHVISASGFTSTAFAAIRAQTDAYLCPALLTCRTNADCSGATPLCQADGVCGACTAPPVITVPADLLVAPSGTCSAAVTFAASAVDCAGKSVSVSCSKATGATFAAGTTTVTCTAGASSASFNVTVQPAGVCTIGGACVAAGTANPANQCQDCEPLLSTSSYSNKAATESCSDGDSCTAGDHCDGNGACAHGAMVCGGTCSAYGTSGSCSAAANCAWSAATGCSCNASQPLQVMFVMDSSSSVTSPGWAQEKSFVTGMINTGLGPGAVAGVVEFSTSLAVPLNFDSDQTRSSLTGVVNGLTWLNQGTSTLDALNAAVTSMDKHDKGAESLILLITGGDPNPPDTQNPCSTTLPAAATLRAALASNHITVVLITVGPGVNAAALGCLYNYDPSRVISASGFTSSALDAIRAKTDSSLCPITQACKANADCGGGVPVCNVATGQCRACTSNSECGGATPVCLSTGCGACTTPPVISAPADFAVDDTGACQAAVTYAASAVDCSGANVPVSCSPAPGSPFPAGVTAVTCTAGSSARSFNVTVNEVNGCLIGGACIESGIANPLNPCQACQPALSGAAFTDKPSTASCDDGLACTGGDFCDGHGACAGGPSTCVASDWCHAAGSCTPGGCGPQVLKPGACFIAGQCIAEGAQDPSNQCAACDPSLATGGYSPRPAGSACDDLNACTAAESCDGAGACGAPLATTVCSTDSCHSIGACNPADGTCPAAVLNAGACFIDGACQSAGAQNPALSCQVCDPSQSTEAWFSYAQPPSIVCPGDVSQVLAAGACGGSPALGAAVGADCGSLTVTSDAPSSFPVGTSAVTWTATDGLGQTATCTQHVTLSTAADVPVIAVAPHAAAVLAGAPITLDASASADPLGYPVSVSWAPMDAATAQVTAGAGGPILSFVAPGGQARLQLLVTVTSAPPCGAPGSQTAVVTIDVEMPPVAVAATSTPSVCGSTQPIVLDGSASTASSGLSVAGYAWSLLDGTPVCAAAICAFTAPALAASTTLTFQLVVTDSDGFVSAPAVVSAQVKDLNEAPVANAGPNFAVVEGATVTLDGSGSYDPNGDALVYSWKQTAGHHVRLGTRTTFTAPHRPGTLIFQLTVTDQLSTDDCGTPLSSTSSVTITVEAPDHPPVARAEAAPRVVKEGDVVRLISAGSHDPDGDPLAYAWAQTEGPAVALSNPAGASPTFVAPPLPPRTSAQLTFVLTVSDPHGLSSSDSVTITDRNPMGPPDCGHAHASVEQLWPPNHQLVAVSILGAGAPAEITSVLQDEPTLGTGPGDTAIDALLNADGTALLRAEAGKSGRTYHVAFEAHDGWGNRCHGTALVTASRDSGRRPADRGALYDSTR